MESSAPKGRRVASDIIDLLIIPLVIGFVLGVIFAFLKVPQATSQIILVVINIGWLFVRDMVFSPGRKMVGLKLISLSGGSVTPVQSVIRNIHLVIPFVLLAAYLCETVHVYVTGNPIVRKVLYVVSGIIVVGLMSGTQVLNPILGIIVAFLVPLFFLIQDKPGVAEGDRLMDHYSKTKVVTA